MAEPAPQTPEPALIPPGMAYGLCADVLHAKQAHARHLAEDAARHAASRGAAAVRSARRKEDDRREMADRLGRQAAELLRLSRGGEAPAGPGVDAAQLGYLLAWLRGWQPGLVELRAELAEAGRPGLLDGLARPDAVRVCVLVVGG